MNSEKTNNGRSSDTMSRNVQSAGDAETDFLARQSADAKNAMSDMLKVIQHDLKGAADVRAWAQQYPWYSVGAAAIAGFAAASVVVPRRGESLEEKLAAMIPESIREQAEADSAEQAERRSHSGGGIFGSLMGTAVEALKTTLQSAVVAAVTTKATESNNENKEDSSGEYPPASADAYQDSVA